VLAEIPNALGYHRIVETSTNGYLVRQFIHSSLYDRISTRPFLEEIEKKWLAFQLLCAVRDCHARNIFHGDIKTENILVTSWGWLYLTDFSSCFKPTYLPEDNPADFSFFFDTSGRRTCYLAPERFLKPGEEAIGKSPINWAMDIFSVGCVIAELFLETPIFSLSQLFRYRLNRDYEPEHIHLNRIADKEIREMVAHMIQIDPQERYSAEEYLNFWKVKAFPEYFYSFLHQYMYVITDPTSGRSPVTATGENLGESDDRVDRTYSDFDKISFFLGFDSAERQTTPLIRKSHQGTDLFPLQIDIPGYRHEASRLQKRPTDNGSLIFVALVVASLRSTARASSRIRGCELLLAFGERLTDEAKLDRILPYVMSLLNDRTDLVRVAALRTVTQLTALISAVSPINSYIFPEYLLPRFQHFIAGNNANPSAWVRASYASCLGSLATTASNFLEMRQALRADGSLPTSDPDAEDSTVSTSIYQNLYDVAREDLIAQFEGHTKALLTDSDVSVRRALLSSVSTLCFFFGSTKASDVILSHLNTYLNDRDWLLKSSFFETIVGVATYVGTAGLEEFIMPLMVQSLADPEDSVVERVIRSFSSIARLGLFQKTKVWELVDIVARFTMHPNIWIREAAAQFLAVSTEYSSIADRHGIFMPIIKVYLKASPPALTEVALLDTLKKPLPRIILELATNWALKADRGLFWKSMKTQKTLSFGYGELSPTMSSRSLGPKTLGRLPKNDEDEHWIQRLRSAGMEPNGEVKLLALREYIWRSAHRRTQEESGKKPSRFNMMVELNELDVSLQTVFFDNNKVVERNAHYFDQDEGPRTIEEALRDASGNENNEPSRPKDIPGAGPRSPIDGYQSPRGGKLRNPDEPSSLDSRQSFRLGDHSLMRKGSSISLIRDTSGKAAPETGTSTVNAFGKVEGSHTRDGKPPRKTSTLGPGRENHDLVLQGRKIQPVHSYQGNDPNILRLLDSLYLENYPVDLIEFGQVVAPRQPIRRGGSSSGSWRPEGILVAMLSEHIAAVNRVVVAPDHKFFVTGSDDGTVKVWDTSRLERSISHRSRLTYAQGIKVKVTALNFVENSHCFISAGSDGSVHVVRVNCWDEDRHGIRYGKLRLMREYQLPAGEFAIWVEHHKVENQSILMIATNTSRIVSIELRSMKVIYELKNPVSHGSLTCFCVDKRHQWLLAGTTHGVLDLWDLRFKLRTRAWAFSNGLPIHRIALPPVNRSSKRYRVTIAGGVPGQIVAFDIEKGQLKEVYKTGIATAKDASPLKPTAIPSVTELDVDERPGSMLVRFTSSNGTSSSLEGGASGSADRSIRSIAMGTQFSDEGTETKSTFILSAGPDNKVRFWDPTRAENSMVVSGLEVDEAKSVFSAVATPSDVVVVRENLPHSTTGQGDSAGGGGSSAANTPSKKNKTARSSIISLQQHNLLRGHKDMILDVALLEWPYAMVVSVDRSGVIYVYS
jgi:phosphoinositide-3-kinase regulatory subunit 4